MTDARRRRLARAPALPGFSQKGDTCGAASLVTALFMWDLERPSAGNTAVIHACDLVLTANDNAKANKTAIDSIKLVRESALAGTKLGQTDYEVLGMAFAILYNGRAGMSSGDIGKLANGMGFRPFADGSGATLAEVLASDAVTKLKPGEVGQLNWIIKATGAGHAMLLGRQEDGTWFFSDQGVVTAEGDPARLGRRARVRRRRLLARGMAVRREQVRPAVTSADDRLPGHEPRPALPQPGSRR